MIIRIIFSFLAVIYGATFFGVDPSSAMPGFVADIDSKLGGVILSSLQATHAYGDEAVGQFINLVKEKI